MQARGGKGKAVQVLFVRMLARGGWMGRWWAQVGAGGHRWAQMGAGPKGGGGGAAVRDAGTGGKGKAVQVLFVRMLARGGWMGRRWAQVGTDGRRWAQMGGGPKGGGGAAAVRDAGMGRER